MKASKSEAKSTPMQDKQKSVSESNRQEMSNRSLNKTQLYISSIKQSVTVSDMKSLYPKAKAIKMKKKKVGQDRKIMQQVSFIYCFSLDLFFIFS